MRSGASIRAFKHKRPNVTGIELKEVPPSPHSSHGKHIEHHKHTHSSLSASPATDFTCFFVNMKQHPVNVTHIEQEKKGAGNDFKASSWQINALAIKFFWSTHPPPRWQLAHILWVIAKQITVQPLSCSSVCVWARETSAIVERLHPDSREPDRLKITQSFPILSSFGTACPGCF